jgi:hypothetical protein
MSSYNNNHPLLHVFAKTGAGWSTHAHKWMQLLQGVGQSWLFKHHYKKRQ